MELDLMFLKKTPPHSPEAEKTVLGGILINNKNLNAVLSIISIEDFYKEGNRKILEKIAQLVDRGLPVDLLSLSEELKKAGDLDEIGGAAYLSSLMDGVPKSLNVEYYAQIIKEKALLRRLILSSATYRQSSGDNPACASVDPENRMLWRAPVRRLEAEAIRDTLLLVGHQLDTHMGGSLLHVGNREFLFNHLSKDTTKYDSRKRSVYPENCGAGHRLSV